MKKALIVSCNDFYDYETRTKYVECYLNNKGYKVEHLISDFNHRTKTYYKTARAGNVNYIHVPSYSRNLSFRRIISHFEFGRKVQRFVKHGNYDLIYHCAPPNFTIKNLYYCKRQKSFFLITEIGDLWPETLPISSFLKKVFYLPLRYWSRLRDCFLANSDIVITECDLFKKKINTSTKNNNVHTIYFCKDFFSGISKKSYSSTEEIILCYLGSINNIIDISMISKVISQLSNKTKVVFHIIGEGEKRDLLIDEIRKAGAEIVFHGQVYDDEQKNGILNACHFAINIMKKEVCVGMTMKSLDYISAGLPLINNIPADIWEMVETQGIGLNISDDNCIEQVDRIINMSSTDYQTMCNSVKICHEKYFSVSVFEKKIELLLESINQ